MLKTDINDDGCNVLLHDSVQWKFVQTQSNYSGTVTHLDKRPLSSEERLHATTVGRLYARTGDRSIFFDLGGVCYCWQVAFITPRQNSFDD